MNKQTTTIVLALVYFAVILLVGFAAGRKTKGLGEFMIGGQKLGVWVTSLGIMAAVMSGWAWIGNPGTAFSQGYAGIIKINSFATIGCVVAYIVLARPVRILSRRKQCYTMPDLLVARWGENRAIRLISTLIIVVGSITYLVSQWASMGTVMQSVLGVSYPVGVLVGGAIISAYVVAGGMLASMWTNFVQMIIMFVVAGVLVVKCVGLCGGMTEMNLALGAIAPSHVQPFGSGSLSPLAALTYAIPIIMIFYGGQPAVNTKFIMIKDVKSLRWSVLISAIAMTVGVSTTFIGYAGSVLVGRGLIPSPERADMILFTVIDHVVSPGLGGMVLVAVMAAVMSTAESHLFNGASSLVHDLLVKGLAIQLDEQRILRYTRWGMAAISLVTMLISLDPPEMISAVGAQAFAVFCAGFGPTLCLGLRWRRVNSKGAVAGMLVGLVTGCILPLADIAFFSGQLFANVTIAGVGALLSLAAVIVVSLLTRPESSDAFETLYN